MEKIGYSLILAAVLSACSRQEAQLVAPTVQVTVAGASFITNCFDFTQNGALIKNHLEELTLDQEAARKASWDANNCDQKAAVTRAAHGNAVRALASTEATSESAR